MENQPNRDCPLHERCRRASASRGHPQAQRGVRGSGKRQTRRFRITDAHGSEPQVGLFGKLFGKSNPVRSFMFAFTGPHAVLVRVRGTAANGDEINCLITLNRGHRETAPRLITFPAKGTRPLRPKTSPKFSPHHQRRCPPASSGHGRHGHAHGSSQRGRHVRHQDALRGVGRIRSCVRSGFITWSSTAAEQQLQHQHDLERLQLSKDIESDKQAIELDHFIKTEQRKHEVNAQWRLPVFKPKKQPNQVGT